MISKRFRWVRLNIQITYRGISQAIGSRKEIQHAIIFSSQKLKFFDRMKKKNLIYLLNPFKNSWDFPWILVDDSSKAIGKNSGNIIGKATTCDVGYPLNPSLTDDVKYLWLQREKELQYFEANQTSSVKKENNVWRMTWLT